MTFVPACTVGRIALCCFIAVSVAASHPNPGRADTFRRLNRIKYQNSIRDLLALDVDVVSMLPGDEAGHGFDNVTCRQSLSDAAGTVPASGAEDQPPCHRHCRE